MDDAFRAKYSQILEKHADISENGECRLWNLKPKDGRYGWMSYKVGGGGGSRRYSWKQTYAHRLAYMIKYPDVILENQVSHLCHNTLCVNDEHLSHEPAAVNNNRQSCVNVGICNGHQSYSDCKLHLKL